MGESTKRTDDVRMLRLRTNLTLCQVSKVIGISSPALSDWENGMLDLKFRVEQMEILLGLYDVAIKELSEAWKNTKKQPNRKERKKAVTQERMHKDPLIATSFYTQDVESYGEKTISEDTKEDKSSKEQQVKQKD